MKFSHLPALFLILSLHATAASGSDPACERQYLDGAQPRFVIAELATSTTHICYSEYTSMHSGLTRTPLWSAEHLTSGRIRAARSIKRVDNFHAEPSLPFDERAELSDYAHSSYDRGHLAPSADFSTPQAQDESYSLANVVAQSSWMNRNSWEWIESAIRTYAVKEGEVYVITGPLFRTTDKKRLRGNVLVPSLMFKAVYNPRTRQAGAYLMENTKTEEYKAISIDQLESMAGINFFPTLPTSVKVEVMNLPAPTPYNGYDGRRHPAAAYSGKPAYGSEGTKDAVYVATDLARKLLFSSRRYY